jgi:hypothetical protein
MVLYTSNDFAIENEDYKVLAIKCENPQVKVNLLTIFNKDKNLTKPYFFIYKEPNKNL